MTCYARPVAFFLLIVGAAMAVFGMFGLLLNIIGFIAASLALAVVAVRLAVSTRHRRAASGACTTCRHQCQLSVDGHQPRPGPVIIADRIDVREPAMWPEAGSWVADRMGEIARQGRK